MKRFESLEALSLRMIIEIEKWVNYSKRFTALIQNKEKERERERERERENLQECFTALYNRKEWIWSVLPLK